jgi:hypothetical protein
MEPTCLPSYIAHGSLAKANRVEINGLDKRYTFMDRIRMPAYQLL